MDFPYPLLSFIYHQLLPASLLDFILHLYRAVVNRFLLVAHPCDQVHWKISFMNSFLLLQQCPACLVHHIWMVSEMGGRWPYSCHFVGCCFQDLFNIACSILVQFPSSFFSIHLVSIYVVHPYSRIDTTAAWEKKKKKNCFILPNK